MKFRLLFLALVFVCTTAQAQFKPTEDGLTIIVTDGSTSGRNSQVHAPSDIPASYDQVPSAKNKLIFDAPIRELGMTDCIQAAAFLERPQYGLFGFMLIFSVNDAIGGRQATLVVNGEEYKGVYRLIRQKISSEEPVPQGMTDYQIMGTFFLLGIS